MIPSRTAPLPPPSASSIAESTTSKHRYTPTTNWDDSPFDIKTNKHNPPPRPPPPRLGSGAATNPSIVPFKKTTPQSVNILSSLFSNKSTAKSSNAKITINPPPKVTTSHTTRHSAVTNDTQELIDWTSPPTSFSPTNSGNRANSDCMSVDSFTSDTTSNASPQNGNGSQSESGFEDDFTVTASTSAASGWSMDELNTQMALIDPFSAPPVRQEAKYSANIRRPVAPPIVAQKPRVINQSAFYSHEKISFQPQPTSADDDPLSNGKSLVATPPTITMPTIIKPLVAAKPVAYPKKVLKAKPSVDLECNQTVVDDRDKTPSPPMPTFAPPPPPPEYYNMTSVIGGGPSKGVTAAAVVAETAKEESYAIALYDYDSGVPDDLTFRANEKIYLLREENAEWMFGRDKRGCQGLVPANYLDIKVPLATVADPMPANDTKCDKQQRRCRALYDFSAQFEGDLSFRAYEELELIRIINDDWLYGRNVFGDEGQFPANFIEFL